MKNLRTSKKTRDGDREFEEVSSVIRVSVDLRVGSVPRPEPDQFTCTSLMYFPV